MVIELAKITLSVPDDLYRKLEEHKDQVNYSQFFRNAISDKIAKIEEKGELIDGLMNYLSGELPKEEDKESIREAEVERFRKKWGAPDSKSNDEEASDQYVNLSKTKKINIGGQTIAELEISNSRVLARSLRERVDKGFGKYNLDLYDKNLKPIVEYFKSQGFTIEEEELRQTGVMHHVLKIYGSKGREEWRRLLDKGYHYFGLFAADEEDRVFIAYRRTKGVEVPQGFKAPWDTTKEAIIHNATACRNIEGFNLENLFLTLRDYGYTTTKDEIKDIIKKAWREENSRIRMTSKEYLEELIGEKLD